MILLYRSGILLVKSGFKVWASHSIEALMPVFWSTTSQLRSLSSSLVAGGKSSWHRPILATPTTSPSW